MKNSFLLNLATSVLLIGACQQSPEQVAFSSTRERNSDIFLLNSKSGEVQALTDSEVEEWAPSWINEEELCFLRQDLGRVKRFKINVNTGEETQIEQPTNCMLNDKNALFLKEGMQIYPCEGHIYLANELGHVQERLTEGLSGRSNYLNLSFDEEYLIFTNNSTGNNDIYRMHLASGRMENLTNHPANDEHGDLSADGQKLLFSSNRFDDNQDIVIMDLNTGFVTNLTKTPQLELIARWGNDPNIIYYGSNKDGDWELYQYDLESQEHQRLTNNPGFDGDPRVFRSL